MFRTFNISTIFLIISFFCPTIGFASDNLTIEHEVRADDKN